MTVPVPRRKLASAGGATPGADGYVLDNMEGAVDQARFLAVTDMPVAVIGARGTGKLYLARIFHQATGSTADNLQLVDCRELRGREESWRRLRTTLAAARDQTLVFKSPQLLHADVQRRLARLIATRRLPDAEATCYLPPCRFVALFPADLRTLVAAGELQERLASVFAGHPIPVPPLRFRPQAILRWAGKILEQEAVGRGLAVKGFTAEAERALRQHHWHGNISELRQRMTRALDARPAADWLSAADLQLYDGGRGAASATLWPLQPVELPASPSAWEELQIALGELLQQMLAGDCREIPLGQWLQDEVLLAALARYGGVASQAANLLQTAPRNVQRWLPAVRERDAQRLACAPWADTARLVGDWVRGMGLEEQPPLPRAEALLLARLEACADRLGLARRARLLNVSRPTYLKRARALTQREAAP